MFDEEAARARCLRVIALLDLPPPRTVSEILSAASLLLRREIRLYEFDGPVSLTGFVIDGGTWVSVHVPHLLGGPLRKHVIAHELGHLLLRHPLRAVRDGLSHADLDSAVEREAELFARLVCGEEPPRLPLADDLLPRQDDTGPDAEEVRRRVESAFPSSLMPSKRGQPAERSPRRLAGKQVIGRQGGRSAGWLAGRLMGRGRVA